MFLKSVRCLQHLFENFKVVLDLSITKVSILLCECFCRCYLRCSIQKKKGCLTIRIAQTKRYVVCVKQKMVTG